MSVPLLEVRDLAVEFRSPDGTVRAVDGISFAVDPGETLALVGESGSGKSVTALSILRILPENARVASGSILLRGRDLLALREREMRAVRGREIAMVFQEPGAALNPVLTCGAQIEEAIRLHERVSRLESAARTVQLLKMVGIPAPEQRSREYPHQLSGGMRQRVMIAMALACGPALLIADEPTTALDVTVQAQILELLRGLQRALGMAVLLVTHDLGIVAGNADRVAVTYAGRVVESCSVADAFARPLHPYTAGLLASLPALAERGEPLRAIPGQVPDAAHPPLACRFHPRCPVAVERCRVEDPPRETFEGGRSSLCWRAGEIAAGTLDPVGGERARA